MILYEISMILGVMTFGVFPAMLLAWMWWLAWHLEEETRYQPYGGNS